MTDKFMYIPNNDIPNYPFCRKKIKNDFTLNLKNQPINFPKVVKPTNKKTLL